MLSIVIIGKNEADNLGNLYNSLSDLNIPYEAIYVDSASTDESVTLSKHYAARIIELEDSPYLCAAAGRYAGTHAARYAWILYLDGDMTLDPEFIQFLNGRSFMDTPKDIAGYIGYYTYIYENQTAYHNRLLQPRNKVVDHFGGAVMLQKEIVLQAGNWNPSVVANEEIDLYIRIQTLGYKVFGLDNTMVSHLAKKVSNADTLLSLFLPRNRRYYGFGQVLVSQYRHHTLSAFITMHPYPFLYLGIVFMSLFKPSFIVLAPLLFMYIATKKKWHYNIVYLSEIPRGVLGLFRYPNYIPVIKKATECNP